MLRNKVTSQLRNSRANFFLTIINNAGGNSKLIWDQLNKLLGQEHKDKKPVDLMLNGKSISDPSVVATAFNNYFVDSVASIAQGFSHIDISKCPILSSEHSLVFSSASVSNIESLISSLNASKAKDVFGMDNTMLKELS